MKPPTIHSAAHTHISYELCAKLSFDFPGTHLTVNTFMAFLWSMESCAMANTDILLTKWRKTFHVVILDGSQRRTNVKLEWHHTGTDNLCLQNHSRLGCAFEQTQAALFASGKPVRDYDFVTLWTWHFKHHGLQLRCAHKACWWWLWWRLVQSLPLTPLSKNTDTVKVLWDKPSCSTFSPFFMRSFSVGSL